MSFRRLAWVFPAAYAVHFAAEAPGFTEWARRNASKRYTERGFLLNNAIGFVSTTAAAVAVTRAQRRALDLAYTLVVTQQAAFNAVFHAVTTVGFREYSPGLVTSVLHLPLWRRLTGAAVAERRLTKRDVVTCTFLARIVHAGVVARQMFFVGVPEIG